MKHHIQFLKAILENRNQNMAVIHNKFDAFFSKLRGSVNSNSEGAPAISSVVSVKFDIVSKVHMFTRPCITESYKACGMPCPNFVYSSLPKVMEKISTKRSVVGKVKATISHGR